MIVICEHCQTRFKLDETRIPPGGARVRCSRCKHAFFLPAPGSDEPDLLDELISQTAAAAATPAPADHDDPSEPRSNGQSGGADRPAGEGAREGEWEFGEDLPGEGEAEERPDEVAAPIALDEGPPLEVAPSGLELASEAVEAALRDERAHPPAPPAPARKPAASAGSSPETAAGPTPDPSTGLPTALASEESEDFDDEEAEAPKAPAFTPLARIELRPASTVEQPVEVEAPARVAPELLEAPERVGRVLSAAGWLCTLVLFSLVLVGLLTPGELRSPAEAPSQPLGQLVAESLEGRFVDNLFVGPLLVVSARLRNAGDAEVALGAVPLAVLLDSSRAPLTDARRPLAPVAERELRELPPETLARRLVERGRSTALRAVPPGESLSVAAVFPTVSPEAWGVGVELGPPVRPQAGEELGASPAEPVP